MLYEVITVATVIASRAMTPVQAVIIVGVFEFLGPLLGGTAVANTIGKFVTLDGVLPLLSLSILLCGLIGAIVWNLATWYFGIPSSSSHALVGGLIGAIVVVITSYSIHYTKLYDLAQLAHFAARREAVEQHLAQRQRVAAPGVGILRRTRHFQAFATRPGAQVELGKIAAAGDADFFLGRLVVAPLDRHFRTFLHRLLRHLAQVV